MLHTRYFLRTLTVLNNTARENAMFEDGNPTATTNTAGSHLDELFGDEPCLYAGKNNEQSICQYMCSNFSDLVYTQQGLY